MCIQQTPECFAGKAGSFRFELDCQKRKLSSMDHTTEKTKRNEKK